MRPAWGHAGLVRSGQEWRTFNSVPFGFHFVPFPTVDWGRGFTLILTFSPQGRRDLTAFAGGTLTLTLSQRARGSEHLGVKFQICGSFGSIWPRLLLARRLEMRPPRPHLAHRWHTAHSWHCASMRPRWPWLGVARSGETFKTVAFSCIWLHSFRLRGTGCEVPVFTGTTEEGRGGAKL